jgi:two-component system nitrogen regulation sensor histidine kinase NtrY
VIDHPELVAELKDAKEAVMTVARRSDGLMSFVNSYRQFSDFNAPNKKPFEVETLFTDITALVTADWASAENSDLEIELSISVKPPSLKVHADRQMIEQLLINLLQNSEHALRGLKVQKIHLSGGINKYGHVMLEVSDTGIGITDEVADKIFVPFYTTRKNGSGVGLALSRQIMSAHSGSIAFSNQAAGGAKFTLIF